MKTLHDIVVKKPVFDGQKLICKFTVPDDFHKFLKPDELFVEYDETIYADESILTIPATASILPLAWLTGSDIVVGKLDNRFKESMDNLQTVFKKKYPRAPFTTEIHAEELLENEIRSENPDQHTALLFSGGVDSAYSMITNMKHKPRLIMLWGADNFPYPERSDHYEKAISIYQKYAQKKNLKFNVIKTNISNIFHDRRIEHTYHKELYYGSFRNALSHSMVLIPNVAPLSITRFNKLIIAASYSPSFDFTFRPRAAVPDLDEKIVWADLKVKHDGYIDRAEKIRALVDDLKNDLTLRVCVRSTLVNGYINDSSCEKCLRTIGSLVLAGVDPNICGFHVDESTFKEMRSYMENSKSSNYRGGWREIQRLLPDNIDQDFYGSRDFLEWFRSFNFELTKKNWFYHDLYCNLPFTLANYLDMVYRKMGINIHEGSFIREVIPEE